MLQIQHHLTIQPTERSRFKQRREQTKRTQKRTKQTVPVVIIAARIKVELALGRVGAAAVGRRSAPPSSAASGSDGGRRQQAMADRGHRWRHKALPPQSLQNALDDGDADTVPNVFVRARGPSGGGGTSRGSP